MGCLSLILTKIFFPEQQKKPIKKQKFGKNMAILRLILVLFDQFFANKSPLNYPTTIKMVSNESLEYFSLILTKKAFFWNYKQSPQSTEHVTCFCLFTKTSLICKQKIAPSQFSQNMFFLCRSFISKRKKLAKRGGTSAKRAKTKK